MIGRGLLAGALGAGLVLSALGGVASGRVEPAQPAPATHAPSATTTPVSLLPAARLATTVRGWSSVPTTIESGVVSRTKVRVRTGTNYLSRTVVLQTRAASGTWSSAQKRRTDTTGRTTLRLRLDEAGAYEVRLRVRATATARALTTATRTVTVPTAPGTQTVYAVGDVGDCLGVPGSSAALIPAGTDPVVVAGDLAYPRGAADDFADCYDPEYGRFKARTLPVPGNHEYYTAEASAYFHYFGARVGRFRDSWYARDLGTWHVVFLDSNCSLNGGCGPGSPQHGWLQRDLDANPGQCLAAVWHHPRWSSGYHGDADADGEEDVSALYSLLAARGADLLVSGHDHDYERFARLAADGRPSATGIRQFVVGTGGADLRPFTRTAPGSQARSDSAHGVLRLDLRPDGYAWEFLPAAGDSFTDRGSDTCWPLGRASTDSSTPLAELPYAA